MDMSAEIRIVDSGSLKAYVTLIIDGEIAISGFKICESKTGGLFVAAPSHKGTNKEGVETYFDDVRFIGDREEGAKDSPLGRQCKEYILAQYQKQVGGGKPAGKPSGRADDRNASAGRAHASTTSAASNNKPEVAGAAPKRPRPSW